MSLLCNVFYLICSKETLNYSWNTVFIVCCTFSSGMQIPYPDQNAVLSISCILRSKRLTIARAILVRPELLILHGNPLYSLKCRPFCILYLYLWQTNSKSSLNTILTILHLQFYLYKRQILTRMLSLLYIVSFVPSSSPQHRQFLQSRNF